MNTSALIPAVAARLMKRFPMLDPEKAVEMAGIAVDVIATPTMIGSGLSLCSVCRAPVRPGDPA